MSWVYGGLLSALVVALAVAALLVHGNPQWSSILYRFQAYVYPRYPHGWIPAPKGFTGRWRCWYSSGVLESEGLFKNGEPDGPYRDWYESGELRGESGHVQGRLSGASVSYGRDGTVGAWSFFRNGTQCGPEIRTPSGELRIVGWFLNGEEVTEEAYYDAAAQDSDLRKLQWPVEACHVQEPSDGPESGGRERKGT